MHIRKNPYIEGMLHYRDQLQDGYNTVTPREVWHGVVALLVIPGLVWYIYQTDRVSHIVVHRAAVHVVECLRL